MQRDGYEVLLAIVVCAATLMYIGGVVWALRLTLQKPPHPPLPEAVRRLVTSIGALLAAHFGRVLGLPETRELFFSMLSSDNDPTRVFQVSAAYIYYMALLSSCVVWAIAGFRPEAEETVKEMCFTLIGVSVAAMAIVLGSS